MQAYIDEICRRSEYLLGSEKMPALRGILKEVLDTKDFKERKERVESPLQSQNLQYLHLYLSAKTIEGCSEQTIVQYKLALNKMIAAFSKEIQQVSTQDIRKYLADYQQEHHLSKVSVDNLRRIISGYFSWLENEDYISKSPARRLHRVKVEHTIKETYTDEMFEKLCSTCTNQRDLSILTFLSSTGVRVGELVHLNRMDINFQERSCVVLGKGNKQREVYFDARTKVCLQEYLRSRSDQEEALFVSLRKPCKRISISGVEKMLKRLSVKCGLSDVYPHKFRRTLATRAIDKGMPIEQVQALLGHVRIDTTMHYAMVNRQNVKLSHRKYLA